jgi:hypothetical protein
MVLRELAQVRVGGGNDRDNLGERGEGNTRSAIGLWHCNSPKTRPRETIEFLGRQTSLAVSLRRALREISGKPACDGRCFLVGGDTVRVRIEFESRRLLRERDRPSDIFIHGGS